MEPAREAEARTTETLLNEFEGKWRHVPWSQTTPTIAGETHLKISITDRLGNEFKFIVNKFN